MTHIRYRKIQQSDIPSASGLMQAMIRAFNASDFSNEGLTSLLEFTGTESLQNILNADKTIGIVALDGETLVGVCVIRDWSHLLLFYVDSAYHRQGIGRGLFAVSLAECLKQNPTLETMTVNSTLFAVEAYQKLGFIPTTDAPESQNGIVFVPMQKQIKG